MLTALTVLLTTVVSRNTLQVYTTQERPKWQACKLIRSTRKTGLPLELSLRYHTSRQAEFDARTEPKKAHFQKVSLKWFEIADREPWLDKQFLSLRNDVLAHEYSFFVKPYQLISFKLGGGVLDCQNSLWSYPLQPERK